MEDLKSHHLIQAGRTGIDPGLCSLPGLPFQDYDRVSTQPFIVTEIIDIIYF
jgi:hypothetical protein